MEVKVLKRVFILNMSILYVLSSYYKKIIEKFDGTENKLNNIKQVVIPWKQKIQIRVNKYEYYFIK